MTIVSPDIVASVSDVDEAFGGGYKFLPEPGQIPEEFHDPNNCYHRLACDLMYTGVPGEDAPAIELSEEYEPVAEIIPKFMRSILGSFQPNHEHKVAGAAMILCEMFPPKPAATS